MSERRVKRDRRRAPRAERDRRQHPANPLALDNVIDRHISDVLKSVDGNVSRAADALEVNRRTIQRFLAKQRRRAARRVRS